MSTSPAAFLMLALCGCGPENLLLRAGPPLAEPPPGLFLAPPVLLGERLGLSPEQAFAQGYYVGDIWFSGGFTRFPELNDQVRSVGLDLRGTDTYATLAREAVTAAFVGALAGRGWVYAALATPVDQAVQPPHRAEARGSGPFDGEDNQNLPRFELEPQPLETTALPALPEGTHALLVPLVVQYYSHNGGWFIGQPNGCPAGGRARVLWALHDAHDGRVLSWGEVGVQTRTPYYYSPNAAELQDYLMTVERELMLRIERQLAP